MWHCRRRWSEPTWDEQRFRIVVEGSIEKFRQNIELGDYLRGTRNRILVEASPTDRIWGIGLAADSPHANNPLAWRGLNLLGFALVTARESLFAT